MLLFEYIILAIIQGFTEPLPISSSGHIKIFKYFFNSKALNDMNFEIIVNFGSLIAIMILYRKEIITIIKDFFMYLSTKKDIYKTNYKYVYLIIIGTIPAAALGLFFKDIIEKYFTIRIIGLMFIITSFCLFLIKDKKGFKEKKDLTVLDAIKVGLFQSIALLPGISRSGATIFGALKSNLTRENALNYSFMLYIPISFASFILSISDIKNNNLLIPYIVSLLISSIVTYYSTKLFINVIKKGKLIYFSIYCFLLGFLIFILF